MYKKRGRKKRITSRRYKKWNHRRKKQSLWKVNIRAQVTPNTMYIVLPMTLRFTLNPDSGEPANYVISANDCFDPTGQAGLYQPMGFQQYMALYNQFTVWKSKISATFISSGDSPSTASGFACIKIRDISTPITEGDQILDSPRGPNSILTNSNAKGWTKLNYGYKMSKFFGRAVTKDDKYEGHINTSPDEQAYYHVSLVTLTETEDVGAMYCMVKVVYYCQLSERKSLPVSVVG